METEHINLQVVNKPCFQLEKRRWWILLGFSAMSFTNATGFVTYSPIVEQSKEYYGVTDNHIEWLSNCWYLIYIIGALPTLLMFKWRLDIALSFGCLLDCLGGWVRWIGSNNYEYALIGQILIALGQLFVLPAPVFIAERWFGSTERITASCIMIFANVLGLSFGFFASAFSVSSSGDVDSLLLWLAFTLSIPLIAAFFAFRNFPSKPANQSSINVDKLDIIATVKTIFSSRHTLIITFTLSVYLGLTWTIISFIDILFTDYGNQQIALLGLLLNISGTFSGTLTSLKLDKSLASSIQPNYDIFMRIFATISIISLIVFALIHQLDLQSNKPLVFITCAFIGIGFQGFVPIATHSFLENLYPLHELTCFTIYNIFANLLGFLGSLAVSIESLGTSRAWMLVSLLFPLYLYLLLVYQTKHSRYKYETEYKTPMSLITKETIFFINKIHS